MQTVYPLSENTGLALTTAKYYTPSGRLIQRDYNGVSLYDYYYNDRDNAEQPTTNHEVKMTDSGRTVYGGGGITPDVKIAGTSRPTASRTRCCRNMRSSTSPSITSSITRSNKQFQVDEEVMQEFRKFLDEQKIPFTEAELAENNDWIRSNIKAELFINEFGQQEGMRVHAESDPEVQKALDLLPQAKQLADNAKKVVAQHNNARLTAQQGETAANSSR